MCTRRDPDDQHLARCAYRETLLAEVDAYAVQERIPPTAARDLWAHLNDVYGEGQRATKATLDVIALGWRPVVGSHDLWQPEAAS
jgi:hypothetical protein